MAHTNIVYLYDTRDDLYISTNVITDMKRLTRATDVRTLLHTYNADIIIGEIDMQCIPLRILIPETCARWETPCAAQASVAEKYGLTHSKRSG